MIKHLFNQPVFKFFFWGIFLFIGWNLFYELFIIPYTGIDRALSINIVNIASVFLKTLGYIPEINLEDTSMVIIDIKGSYGHGVWIGEPCNGLKLFSLFTIFIIAYPGNWKRKLVFIPIGILLIHLINSLRVAILAIIAKDSPETLDFNHNYTFTIIVYSFIFLLWYMWSTKFSKKTVIETSSKV